MIIKKKYFTMLFQNLANLVGSRGFELDTATQIMKIFQTQREDYDNTEVGGVNQEWQWRNTLFTIAK